MSDYFYRIVFIKRPDDTIELPKEIFRTDYDVMAKMLPHHLLEANVFSVSTIYQDEEGNDVCEAIHYYSSDEKIINTLWLLGKALVLKGESWGEFFDREKIPDFKSILKEQSDDNKEYLS